MTRDRRFRHRLMQALATLALGLGVSPSQGATLHVPGDYASVLAAVDAAAEADTVLVGPGTWSDTDTRVVYSGGFPFTVTACAFPAHGMTILSDGSGVASVQHPAVGSGFLEVMSFVEPVGSTRLTLRDLTLTAAGAANVSAIVSSLNAGVECHGCVLTGVTNNYSGIIRTTASPLVLTQTRVEDCRSSQIVRVFDEALDIEDCHFEGNIGKCVQVAHSTLPVSGGVRVEDTLFRGNVGPGGGVCVDVTEVRAGVLVSRNVFVANRSDERPGAALRVGDSIAAVEFNVFDRDSSMGAANGGAGISWESSFGLVQNNTFVGCHGGLGGAFVSAAGGGVGFNRNVVAFSTGGPAMEAHDTSIAGNSCNVYWQNAAGDFGTWPSSPNALFTDPLFCNRLQGDLTIQEDSPCVLSPCAPIGALGVACDGIAIEPWSWGRTKALFRP